MGAKMKKLAVGMETLTSGSWVWREGTKKSASSTPRRVTPMKAR